MGIYNFIEILFDCWHGKDHDLPISNLKNFFISNSCLIFYVNIVWVKDIWDFIGHRQ